MCQAQGRPFVRMRKLLEARLKPAITTVALLAFLIIGQIIEIVYAINGGPPPEVFEFLYPFAFLGLVCWWLQKDSTRTGVNWPLDMGMFLYQAWIFVLPYHLLKTRGIRGLIDLGVFAAALVAAWILLAITWMILTSESIGP